MWTCIVTMITSALHEGTVLQCHSTVLSKTVHAVSEDGLSYLGNEQFQQSHLGLVAMACWVPKVKDGIAGARKRTVVRTQGIFRQCQQALSLKKPIPASTMPSSSTIAASKAIRRQCLEWSLMPAGLMYRHIRLSQIEIDELHVK